MTVRSRYAKPIPGFPNYRVDRQGRVFSLLTNRQLKTQPNRNRGGYLMVYLRKDGKTHCRKVHRLVLETFVGPCPKDMESFHKNDTPTDNRLANLEWRTHRDNIYRRRKRRGEENPAASTTNKMAKAIRTKASLGRYHGMIRDLSKEFNLPTWTVRRILSGQTY